jgi:hypothetical protein
MIDRIGRVVATTDNGDFVADNARYRGLAGVALKPLTGPSATMVDATYQAVSFDGYWAINGRSDFKKAAETIITFTVREIREVDEQDDSDSPRCVQPLPGSNPR